MMYQLYKSTFPPKDVIGAMTVDAVPFVSFLFDPANTDYQAYLAWLELGNQPEPADNPPTE